MDTFYDVMDESTFPIVAAKAYTNSDCLDIIEFKEDLNRIRSIKKIFNKYKDTGQLRTLLVLNHLTVFYNVFQPEECATKMLVYRLSDYLPQLSPFLIALNRWPKAVMGLGLRRETIWMTDIPMDERVIRELSQLRR